MTITEPVMAYDPLYRPTPMDDFAHPADLTLRWGREALATYQDANIHDHTAMACAAVGLYDKVRLLVNALDAETAMCRPDLVAAWRKPAVSA